MMRWPGWHGLGSPRQYSIRPPNRAEHQPLVVACDGLEAHSGAHYRSHGGGTEHFVPEPHFTEDSGGGHQDQRLAKV
jgi:hypothetical protein